MNCKHCDRFLDTIPGKVKKQFCSDTCRKAFKRAQPRTNSTPDKPNQPTPDKVTFADLPADVQHQIEQHCSENNNGARASSHSRASMTERALAYQAKMGKRPGRGVIADPRYDSEGRTKHLDDCLCHRCNPTGPLDVYSQSRWASLQAKGYEWDSKRGNAYHSTRNLWAVPVPGDPAYGETSDNVCSECGKPTDHKLVVKCGSCSWSKTG